MSPLHRRPTWDSLWVPSLWDKHHKDHQPLRRGIHCSTEWVILIFTLPRLKNNLNRSFNKPASALTLAHTRPCISVQPACSTTAVISAAHPAKPLTAAGATFSRGERDIRASPRAHSEPFKLSFTYFLCAFRCSDGMDRHRQEWLDYACSNQVLLEMKYVFFFPHFWYWCIEFTVYMQSKDATCEVYSTAHTSTRSAETQEVTSLTPLQRTCGSEDKLFYGKLKNVFFRSHHKRILSFLSDVTTKQILQTGNINCHTYRGQSLWRNFFLIWKI